jgi:membrane associated rhomboid family serine protease
MIPVGDVVPTRTPPVVTIALLVAQGLIVVGLPLGPAVIHLAVNTACLWNYGGTVEDRMGHARFLAFYGLGCVVAAAVRWFTGGLAPLSIAACSGGVAAVVGAYAALYPQSRLITLVPIPPFAQVVELPALVLACSWLVLQFASRVGVSATAAVVVGAATVRLFRRRERMRVEWWNGG